MFNNYNLVGIKQNEQVFLSFFWYVNLNFHIKFNYIDDFLPSTVIY
jgi:hypothetical protein